MINLKKKLQIHYTFSIFKHVYLIFFVSILANFYTITLCYGSFKEILYFEGTDTPRAIVEYSESNDTMTQRKKHGKETTFYEDGKTVAYTAYYKQGVEDGNKTWFDRGGNIIGIMPYKNGLRHGKHTLWFSNGYKRYEVTFVNDLEEGIARSYHENGALASEVIYKKGRKNGVERTFHPNGALYSKVRYINGYKEGEQLWFNKDGKIIQTEHFKRGRPQSFFQKQKSASTHTPLPQTTPLQTLNFNPNEHRIK